MAGDYIYSSANFRAAVSTDGHTFIAYVCDGVIGAHKPTFAEWFKGTVTGTHIVVTNADGANLDVYLHPWVADGQVILRDGTQYYFLGAPVTNPEDPAKLLRSEQTIAGVTYLAGWIDPGLPGAEEIAYISPLRVNGSQVPIQLAVAAGWDNWCISDCRGGAIRDLQTGVLMASPALTAQDVASKQVSVPGIGTLDITVCHLGKCT